MGAIQKIPENFLESSASYVWLDSDGILVVVNKPVAVHTKTHAEESVAIVMEVSAGIPRPLLIDISDVKTMSREAREIYANVSSKERVRAVGLITKSAMSRILGNFFLSFNRPSVPVKLFADSDLARKWLLTHL